MNLLIRPNETVAYNKKLYIVNLCLNKKTIENQTFFFTCTSCKIIKARYVRGVLITLNNERDTNAVLASKTFSSSTKTNVANVTAATMKEEQLQRKFDTALRYAAFCNTRTSAVLTSLTCFSKDGSHAYNFNTFSKTETFFKTSFKYKMSTKQLTNYHSP